MIDPTKYPNATKAGKNKAGINTLQEFSLYAQGEGLGISNKILYGFFGIDSRAYDKEIDKLLNIQNNASNRTGANS